jgi:predicted component of type VI protein secretion system
MPEHAYRACPHCGTHNRHYMFVCTRCTRSLQDVALVGTPPPGSEIGGSSDRLLRITLGALALLAAATVAVLLSRLLASGAVEGRAAAASAADAEVRPRGPSPVPPVARGAWETLEERWAERPAIPAPSTSPAAAPPTPGASARAPAATPATTPPAPVAPPSSPAAPPPTAPVPVTAPAPAAVEPRDPAAEDGPRRAPRARAAAAEPAEDVGDPERVRSERRAALRRAEQGLQRLERRAEELRERMREQHAEPEEQDARRQELATVLRRVEQAEREVIRAEWALSEVEQ